MLIDYEMINVYISITYFVTFNLFNSSCFLTQEYYKAFGDSVKWLESGYKLSCH